MEQLIIYKEDIDGGYLFSMIAPADCGLTIEQIAEKDTPKGASYWIVPRKKYKPSDDDDFHGSLEEIVKGIDPDGEGVGNI